MRAGRPGYEPARDPAGHATRVIVPAEALVINRLFALAADGLGVKRIASTLNAERTLAPRKAGRTAAWSPSTVRGVLGNALYRGTAEWGKSMKRDVWGQRRPSRRSAADVVRVDVPALRIVDEALWQRAHARRDASRALYDAVVGAHGRAGGRPPSGSASRYLLSGLASCACCNSSMFVRARGRQHTARWGCMTRHLRGAAVCPNGLEVRLDDTDAAVLEAVASQLLRVEVLETALAKALAALEGPNEDTAGLALRDEAARLEAEVVRLAEAIARGGDLPTLVAALQAREERRAHVRAALAELKRQRGAPRAQGDTLNLMRTTLADWQGLLQQETGPARTALQSLLTGRLVFTPEEHDDRRFYRFEGPGTVAPIISGIVEAVSKGRGPRTRTIPPALRRALHHRDRSCRFPGCGVRFGQGHHLRHWAHGGPTTLSNLALLCRRHHRAVHEEGYQVARGSDGALRFRRPDGRPVPEVPSPAAVPRKPVEALRVAHESQGLRLNARTACAGWLGERLDVGWAIDVLHPLAQRALPSPSSGQSPHGQIPIN